MKIRHRHTRIVKSGELCRLLAEHGGISDRAAKRLFSTLMVCIGAALQYGHTVQLQGIGKLIPSGANRAHVGKGGEFVAREWYRIQFESSKTLLEAMRTTDRGMLGRERVRNPPVDVDPIVPR